MSVYYNFLRLSAHFVLALAGAFLLIYSQQIMPAAPEGQLSLALLLMLLAVTAEKAFNFFIKSEGYVSGAGLSWILILCFFSTTYFLGWPVFYYLFRALF